MRAETNQTAPVLAYGERIYADGLGGFTIEPIAVTQPQLAQGQQDLFEILQRAREGYLFRYRDFAVRDVETLYDEALTVGSDHALVVASVELPLGGDQPDDGLAEAAEEVGA